MTDNLYINSPRYPHHLQALNRMKGIHKGKTFLIILGGPSGANARQLISELKPDITIGANGVIRAMKGDLDYWICMESWDKENPPEWFQDKCRGKRLITWKRYDYLKDKTNAYSVRRGGPKFAEGSIDTWNPREYQGGLYHCEKFNRPEITAPLTGTFMLGTVAIQCLHFAALVGAKKIYTTGLDLCFRDSGEHWYPEVNYSHSNMWWDERMFTTYKGFRTMWWWVDSAKFLVKARKRLQVVGCEWVDLSDGLYAAMEKEQ
jgi:hypothetical protein